MSEKGSIDEPKAGKRDSPINTNKVLLAENQKNTTPIKPRQLSYNATATPPSPEPHSITYQDTPVGKEPENSAVDDPMQPESRRRGEKRPLSVQLDLEDYAREVQGLIDETIKQGNSNIQSNDEGKSQKSVEPDDIEAEDEVGGEKCKNDLGFMKDLLASVEAARSWRGQGSGRYWEEPKRQEKLKCFQCGKLGHLARSCSRTLENMCYICGSEEHGSNNCQNERCDRCLEYGHDENECGKKRVKLTFCMRCGSRDHNAVDCDGRSVEELYKGLRCMACYEIGHLNCAGPRKAKTLTWCCNCGSNEHVKSRCRNLGMSTEDIALGLHSGRQAGGRFYPFKSCYHCASLKHLARDCVKGNVSYGSPRYARWNESPRWGKGNQSWKNDRRAHSGYGKEFGSKRNVRDYSSGKWLRGSGGINSRSVR